MNIHNTNIAKFGYLGSEHITVEVSPRPISIVSEFGAGPQTGHLAV